MTQIADSGVESLDIVIPVYNEQRVLDLLVGRLAEVFSQASCDRHGLARWRVIFVDDGSTDGTAHLIRHHLERGFPGMCIRFSRNFGHQSAVAAGLDHADADAVAVIDADLQDPPELILDMLDRLRQDFDVVYGQRMNRTDPAIKRLGAWIFYRLVSLLSDIKIPFDSGDFCVIRRRVVLAMRSLPEHLRFPRVLRAWVGFRQTGIAYSRPDRAAGITNYSWNDLYRLATDGIASASIRPLRLAQVFAWSYMAVALLTLAAVVFRYRGLPDEGGITMRVVAILNLSGVGLIMFCLYILGAYVGRMYLEIKARPAYIVMEMLQSPGLRSQASGRS